MGRGKASRKYAYGKDGVKYDAIGSAAAGETLGELRRTLRKGGVKATAEETREMHRNAQASSTTHPTAITTPCVSTTCPFSRLLQLRLPHRPYGLLKIPSHGSPHNVNWTLDLPREFMEERPANSMLKTKLRGGFALRSIAKVSVEGEVNGGANVTVVHTDGAVRRVCVPQEENLAGLCQALTTHLTAPCILVPEGDEPAFNLSYESSLDHLSLPSATRWVGLRSVHRLRPDAHPSSYVDVVLTAAALRWVTLAGLEREGWGGGGDGDNGDGVASTLRLAAVCMACIESGRTSQQRTLEVSMNKVEVPADGENSGCDGDDDDDSDGGVGGGGGGVPRVAVITARVAGSAREHFVFLRQIEGGVCPQED